MLTISGMHKGETKLTIPNQVVREQLFAYILDTYHENDLTFDSYEKRKLVSGLAYDGKWKPYFEYIAGCLHRYASQQDKQKGEYFVHGFTLAITAQNPFYRPVSEKDSQEGYVNLFLHPLLDIYKDMSHSYIIELKYAKGKDSSERIEQLKRQAIEQAERYASSESVQKAISPTMLHKIICCIPRHGNGCLRRIVIDKRQCLPLQWKHSFVRSIHVFIESTKLFICNYKDKMPFFR